MIPLELVSHYFIKASTCYPVDHEAAHVVTVLLSPGVCMKQQKKLNEAIDTAQDHGT